MTDSQRPRPTGGLYSGVDSGSGDGPRRRTVVSDIARARGKLELEGRREQMKVAKTVRRPHPMTEVGIYTYLPRFRAV